MDFMCTSDFQFTKCWKLNLSVLHLCLFVLEECMSAKLRECVWNFKIMLSNTNIFLYKGSFVSVKIISYKHLQCQWIWLSHIRFSSFQWKVVKTNDFIYLTSRGRQIWHKWCLYRDLKNSLTFSQSNPHGNCKLPSSIRLSFSGKCSDWSRVKTIKMVDFSRRWFVKFRQVHKALFSPS